MKCQRCGNDEVRQEGYLMTKARGPDAAETLALKGVHGNLTASVCYACSTMLKRLGWK